MCSSLMTTPRTRMVLRLFVASAGYAVDEAESADDALRHIEARAPAVAFCDVHMSGANGLWLADQIRIVSPTTAIVLATGDAEIPPFESFRPGIVAYLLKPFERARVLRAVEDGLRWSADATLKAALGRPASRVLEGGRTDES